jgi:hypothetical protein
LRLVGVVTLGAVFGWVAVFWLVCYLAAAWLT